MSAKWVRSKKWDDDHIPGALWPVKAVLRAFSSITLAVILLLGVVLYAILASVPVGLLALAPTYLIYGMSLVGVVGVMAALPVWLGSRALRGWPRGTRFVGLFLAGLGLAGVAVWIWTVAVWPALRFDAATGSGLRLFAGFIEANKALTIRRLPILEMNELEFYAWWPLRVILLLFIMNLIVATVRRIEFALPYIGVLSVHTGIVLIAVGSIYYSRDKVEGDILLMAGAPGPDGLPTPGPPERRFFDHFRPALHIQIDGLWFQRPLAGLPRYNDYNLSAGGGQSARETINAWSAGDDGGRTLDIAVPDSRALDAPAGGIGRDLRFRVVGYAAYAEPEDDWVRVDPATLTSVRPGMRLNPVRFYELYSALAGEGQQPPDGIGKPVARLFSLPSDPRARTADNGVFGVEYTIGMPAARWADLGTELPEGTMHALVVEVPLADGTAARRVEPVTPGSEFEVGGYRLRVEDLAPTPPFPIITEGYRDAQSSVAIVHVMPPAGGTYSRWVYHRFPEISQDLLEETNERGMPLRRDADPSIRIGFIDASQLQVFIDEPAGSGGDARAIIRQRGGAVRVVEGLKPGSAFEIVSKVSIGLSDRWEHAEAFERPSVVPESQREKDFVGTHGRAMAAVEVSLVDSASGQDAAPMWSRVIWLPFSKFLGAEPDRERRIDLPDGRRLTLAFGRQWSLLPGFALALTDFEMVAYDHRGSPRDYQSRVRVECMDGSFESFEHITKLNNPLRAPFMWSESRGWLANAAGRVASGLNPRQFKFSQAGWDAEGWRQTQELADQGIVPRPFASFTILGVGNNPGIHIIAFGGFLMSVGIPWAFYVKPLIVQARKRRIQRQLAEGTYRKPGHARELAGVEA
jgi:hypothetical protein